VGLLATAVLVVSIVGAMIAFHNAVARYVFALSRERVLPARLARVSGGERGGAPLGGSLLQTFIALMAILLVVLVGADPMKWLFTVLSTVAAIGVLALLTACAAAGGRLLARVPHRDRGAGRVAAPLGVLTGGAVLLVLVTNLHALLGVPAGSTVAVLLPVVVAAAAGAGAGWGLVLRSRRPAVYAVIGRGRPHPLAVPDRELASLEV
jgi:amino acid transporter